MRLAGGQVSGQTGATHTPMTGVESGLVRIFVLLLCCFARESSATVYMLHHCGRTIRTAGDLILSQGSLYYPPNANCTVTIQAVGEGSVLLQLKEVDLRSGDNCSRDYLEITHIQGRDESGAHVTKRRICDGDAPSEVVSMGSYLQVRMATDSHLSGRGIAGIFTTVSDIDGNVENGTVDAERASHCVGDTVLEDLQIPPQVVGEIPQLSVRKTVSASGTSSHGKVL
ncbi:uncharacterized protein [Diadema antillarum]|uniref:uncharacterized protein n=1 Tax=Diadema antillarum TaxID=105358 RepID=UPI003A858F76